MSYRIRIAFFRDHDETLMPTVLAACDEYTEEAFGGVPDFYEDALKNDPARTRELFIDLNEGDVLRLFAPPVVPARIDGDDRG